jgi:hypothetical protein
MLPPLTGGREELANGRRLASVHEPVREPEPGKSFGMMNPVTSAMR